MTFGKDYYRSVEMPWRNILMGNSMQIKNEIKMSNADTSPSIAPGNKLERRAVPSISFFEDSKSSYVINIGRKKIRLDYC